MTKMTSERNKVIFTKIPQNIVDEFLDRSDDAYHEADTMCVITAFNETSVHQEIHKLNSKLVFDYTLQ